MDVTLFYRNIILIQYASSIIHHEILILEITVMTPPDNISN